MIKTILGLRGFASSVLNKKKERVKQLHLELGRFSISWKGYFGGNRSIEIKSNINSSSDKNQ
jgi:hypothetical protein